MFKFFSGTFNMGNLAELGNLVESFISTIDSSIDELSKEIQESTIEEKISSFIDFQQDDDMYLLKINLNGIDLRELSIKYNPGVIDINLKRTEVEQRGIGYFTNNVVVKKKYHKNFGNIEEIDTSRLIKTVENGVLKIRMPKKYVLNESSNIIDVNYYVEDKDKD